MEARSPNNKNIPSELTFSLDIDTPPHGSLGWSVSGTLGKLREIWSPCHPRPGDVLPNKLKSGRRTTLAYGAQAPIRVKWAS